MKTTPSRPREPWKAFQIRQRNPELKREALLMTAAHLFLRRGYRRTSMNDIAQLLKITKPAVYYYFKNKEDILIGCYSHGIASILARLDDADGVTGTGLEKTRTFVQGWVDVIISLEFGRCVATLDDGELSPKTRKEVRNLKSRIDKTLRGLIEEGITDGTIRACNSKLASFAIGGAVNWIGTWYNPEGELSKDKFVESFSGILVDGLSMPLLRNRSKPAGKPTGHEN